MKQQNITNDIEKCTQKKQKQKAIKIIDTFNSRKTNQNSVPRTHHDNEQEIEKLPAKKTKPQTFTWEKNVQRVRSRERETETRMNITL